MKFLLCMGLFVLSQTWLHAQQPLELKLWPEGMPNDNGMTCQEENGVLYVAEPTLTVYPATEGNGMAIVACPGGGYGKLATDHEGKDMAAWFNNQGITYAVLKYRMPNGHKEVPLSDARQAMRILRHRAGEWQLKRIGIMGFSAGGHLASTVATHFEDEESHPDFQILFYPVISMDPEYTHRGTHDNLLGKQPAKEEEDDFSNELHVDGNTPPAFILHSSDDRSVPVAHSLNYYMALLRHQVPATLHIYPIGGHGWGYRDSFTYKREWTGELEKWLREINK
ncbi:alpha/beta hydrolase [Phocaeicola faecicola]|jgi:acetyl esterase/lipase|uniref:alpha/beta hydrolase n=1 Tax=Phocaeicola faecicola TaxID=2739389 RepID=UPI002A827570|nr:alpha/beta hydrolase [Phocaeicola faecicola]MCI5743174.1 alpha/beta hydrolase [Bacteroides sp.]MDD6908266.1 alpha/beta hydrolase [Bacteroidaceae bacterium]MDY4873161.1 alpha/beta hydrolase [Phocaeicola faecicola]